MVAAGTYSTTSNTGTQAYRVRTGTSTIWADLGASQLRRAHSVRIRTSPGLHTREGTTCTPWCTKSASDVTPKRTRS
eukprot:scaffold293523_cov22-Prasinocladus_malaysianus.AAC.1